MYIDRRSLSGLLDGDQPVPLIHELWGDRRLIWISVNENHEAKRLTALEQRMKWGYNALVSEPNAGDKALLFRLCSSPKLRFKDHIAWGAKRLTLEHANKPG
jgi:hypothetical protein